MTEEEMYNLSSQKVDTLSATFIRENGFLRTHDPIIVNHLVSGNNLVISISQHGIRSIEVKSSVPVMAQELWNELHDVRQLCELFEGEFLTLKSAQFSLDDTKTDWSDELVQEYQRRSLLFYSSGDFSRGATCFFISPLDVLSDEIINEWIDVKYELEIIHPMVLYGISNTGMPVDIKVAILTQAFEPLFELIQQHHPDTTLVPALEKPNGGNDSKLRRKLETTVQKYGTDIFAKEIEKDIHSFCQVLVNCRNRIFHIKTKNGKLFLTGDESVLYITKLSILYRRILLDLLSVEYAIYEKTLKEKVSNWDSWNGILESFLSTRWTDD